MGLEFVLNAGPQRLIDDGRVQTLMDLMLVADAAGIDRVGQDGMDGAMGEDGAAPTHTAFEGAALRADATVLGFPGNRGEAFVFVVEREDRADVLRLAGVDHQAALIVLAFDVITQRGHPAHPHPLLLRRRDLVANALGCDLALKLGEG